jgi:ferredoxin-fold anticodon binding domain-containing protein
MLTWRTYRLRQLEIKMSLSVIHCMSSDSIWEWTAGTSTQQIHSSGVVIEEQLPQIIFINIQNLQHKTLSCKLINLFLYKLLLDIQKNYLQDKLTVIFLIYK